MGIEELPSIKKLLEDIDNAEKFRKALPYLNLVAPLSSVDVSKIEESLTSVEELKEQVQDHISTANNFNSLFADKGWIIYDGMDMKVAKSAVEKAQAGDVEEANHFLIDYYNSEHVRLKLRGMYSIKAFRPRVELALLALEDYKTERYHACVPVVLALMDGLINDVNPTGKGIHSNATELKAWDSIAAHDSGLGVIVRKLQKTRQKTRTEVIDFPYRNGILHGMDLGYATKEVAAKTWALLFCVADWAQLAEADRLEESPPRPDKSWGEVFAQLKKTNEFKEILSGWQPRQVVVGDHVPSNGDLAEYTENTPEKTVVEFLHLWQKRNYGHMAKLVSNLSKMPISPKTIRQHFEHNTLRSFEILSIVDQGASLSRVLVALDSKYNREFEFIVVRLNEEGKPEIREGAGQWLLTVWRA